MHYSPLMKTVVACLFSSLLIYGCANQQPQEQATSGQPAAEVKKQDVAKEKVYKGQVVGKSNKAKNISIEVGKGDAAKTIMLKFDEKTKGVESAVKGHAVIIAYEQQGKNLYAKSIKPKLAKLPPGVVEIKTEGLQALIEEGTEMFLVDSRPASRYGQSHLPDAVSIPVPLLKEKKAALLPEDKDKLLIFYCGGPT